MGGTNWFKDISHSVTNKTLLPSAFHAFLTIALLCLCFHIFFFTSSAPIDLPCSIPNITTNHSSLSTSTSNDLLSSIPNITTNISSLSTSTSNGLPSSIPNITTNHSSLSTSTSPEKEKVYEKPCDYSNGKWVREREGPLYNGTTCDMIKKSQNCMTNGRPDSGYLYWRWKPSKCKFRRFEPNTFFQLIRNKHVAFVGDSLSRNQLESLLCMLGTVSKPGPVQYKISHDRWHFPSHNASLSFYWSPFLVQGVQRVLANTGPHYNTIYLDHVNKIWAEDIDEMDLIVLSFGHWFSVPSLYYEGDKVLGCFECPRGFKYTEIGYYGPLRKALRTSLDSIIERKVVKGNGIDVIVRTFSPTHFEGHWDKGGTCSKTIPYRKGKKKLKGDDAEIRRIEIEEVENAKAKAKQFGRLRLEVLDITKLALLRADGHPGAYRNPFPFANGVPEHVQNDCVHWCLPGPIDTWNEIFLEMVKKWEEQPRS